MTLYFRAGGLPMTWWVPLKTLPLHTQNSSTERSTSVKKVEMMSLNLPVFSRMPFKLLNFFIDLCAPIKNFIGPPVELISTCYLQNTLNSPQNFLQRMREWAHPKAQLI